MEIQEYKNPDHIYCSIQYTDIQYWNGLRQTKETLRMDICNSIPYELQLGFSAKNILNEFVEDLLLHIYRYMYDLGRFTYDEMEQHLAELGIVVEINRS